MTGPLEQAHVYREIHEQPDVIRRLLTKEQGSVAELARSVASRGITHVLIAARGTSDNAARYAQYVLGVRNELLVGLAAPSIFTIYGRAPRLRDALVLGISQSGTSPDIVAVLAEARRQGALTAVMTNAPRSDLAAQGDVVIDLQAGKEQAVAATKTYTAELAAVALLSAQLSADADAMAALEAVPDAMAAALAANGAASELATRCRYMERAVVIGRGFNYATAFELALKLKELTYTVVEPYSSADFLHGPVALIQSGFPVIVVAPSGKMLPDLQSFIEAARSAQAELVVISDDDATLRSGRMALPLAKGVPEWLSPLTAIVPGQLFAVNLAHTRDLDPDHPRGLQKVTETF